jgi:sugar-phosphatase
MSLNGAKRRVAMSAFEMSEFEMLLAGRRLFIFDLDGTLADTSPVHAAAFATALAARGIAVDYGSVAGLTTSAAMEMLLAAAGQRATPAELNALVAAKRAAARENLASVREITGASAFIDAARERHRLALCTSAARATALATVERLGLTGRFDPIVTGDDVVLGKPAPEGFLTVLNQAGVNANEALVFEDSEAGMAAAAATGIDAIRIGDDAAQWHDLTVALAGVMA